MGTSGHKYIGSMILFRAVLDLLSNTVLAHYLLYCPKLHSNYSAAARAMRLVVLYRTTTWWCAGRKQTPLPSGPSACAAVWAYKARRNPCCRCLALFFHLRVSRCCFQGDLRDRVECWPGRGSGVQVGAGERDLPRSATDPPFAALRPVQLCRLQLKR